MDLSSSDSDDFFSDIRAFRRKVGLKGALSPPAIRNSPTRTQPLKRKAETPRKTPAKTAKRAGSEDNAHTSASQVTPKGEVARILFSPQQRQRRQRPSNEIAQTPIRIPARTPESRIASPYALLQLQNAAVPKPPAFSHSTESPIAHKLKQPLVSKGKSTPSPARSLQSPYEDLFSITPDTRIPSVKSLWDKDIDSPLRTPARHLSAASPVSSFSQQFQAAAAALTVGIGASDPYSIAEADGSNSHGLLGSVEEALTTDADIDLAKRKLGEEQALIQQQIIRETRERLLAFAQDDGYNLSHIFDSASESVLGPVTLLCQFYTFGHGQLAYVNSGVVWRGDFLGPIATIAQSAAGGMHESDSCMQCNTTLLFPWTQVTAVRKKPIDSDEYIMLTVDEDMGVAFKVNEQQSPGEISLFVEDMAKSMSQALKLQHRHNATDGQGQPDGNSRLDMPGSVDEHTLVRSLLLKAKENVQFRGLDVSRAMSMPGFSEMAGSLVGELSKKIAERAQQALEACGTSDTTHKSVDDGRVARYDLTEDDPGTETLSGTCTLCYADTEAIVLQPCEHRLCSNCFANLQSMQPSSSKTAEHKDTAVCICPWDRNHISSWTRL